MTFVKGDSGNPKGRPKSELALRGRSREIRFILFGLLNDYGQLNLEELKQILEDPKRTAMEIAVARLYSKTISGSVSHLHILFDRILGPVTRHVDITSDGERTPITTIINSLDPEMLSAFVVNYRLRIESELEPTPELSQGEEE